MSYEQFVKMMKGKIRNCLPNEKEYCKIRKKRGGGGGGAGGGGNGGWRV